MNIDFDYDEIYFEDVDKKIELERDFIFKLDSSDKDNKIVEISKSTELYIDTFIDKINDMYNRKVIEWSNNNIENDTCSIDICINDIKLLDKI